MDDSMSDVPSFHMSDDESDNFAPTVKAKTKTTVKKSAAPKAKEPKVKATKEPKAPKALKATKATAPKTTKSIQTTLNMAPKKRSRPGSDDEDEQSDNDSSNTASQLSNTPPNAKKQKKAPASKRPSAEALHDVENESILEVEPKPKKTKTSTEQYQKLTQLEHIIKRPDTYIGSVEKTEQTMWVFNSESKEMELRKVTFVPGLYKIFDEIMVNAADNKQNDPNMKNLKVVVDREKGEISVENDGRGIPVEIHEAKKIYIPEMIFGHLLTGSNYDDEEAKTTGGRNGYGAKLCNIFSTEFTLETQDSNTGKRYKQTWTDNMSKMGKARISSSKNADFTRVTFTPDWTKFRMTGIDDDFEAMVKRRVYDMAGTVKGVKVYLNGSQIKLDFKKYIEMYAKAINKERGLEDSSSNTVIIEDSKGHPKWEVGFAVSDGSFQQVSFVNSIATTSGGTHVNYIADQICDKLLEVVKKRNPKGAALKSNQVRNHIFLFVNCLITNPAFTSQTKEQLTTRKQQFGSKCVLTDDFLKKIGKTEAVENILNFAAKKADLELAKSDGNRRSRMNNPKLVDANLAGTKRGHECTLILTEGDSAKGLAVAGRAVLDPDRIGVFPLRGKLLNVRDASHDQIAKNAEIQNIKQFLGLKHKTVYNDTLSLRYGHLMIMADQDHDGSHIKGLLINFLQVQYPSLLKLPEFFREFITPIVKVWKGPNPNQPTNLKSFFTMPEYEEWKEAHANDKGWRHKYYKGLGTSKPEDAQIYFTHLDVHLREFEVIKPEEEEMLDLAFSKKKADSRKQWLGNFVPGTYLDHTDKMLTYDNFINKELILFSMADNLRSIPSVIDGLKPGQRKVMYASFKRNLINDMKVVELAGYVSQVSAYHHGEASMQMTIVGLAQNFVGSNNVNCLEPSGNFGTRLQGGSDAASARYIFTRLSPFARRVFSVLDDPVLEYNVDDGRSIEPVTYFPVVPMVLINGADGIGTGWSTSIPNYHPVEIVNNLKRRMGRLDGSGEEKPFETMMPWYRGWKGTPEPAGPDRYKFNGIIRETGDTEVEITELPIRMWTDDFKARLEEIIKAEKVPSFIKDYREFNDHKTVHMIIQMDEKHMKAALAEGLAEKFKLNKTVATSNLVAFDHRGQIRKYEKVEDILEEFYEQRFKMYTVRKAYWMNKLNVEYRKLTNQARFVTEIIENKLIVSKKRKPVLVAELRKRGYEAFPKVSDAKKAGETDDVVENEEEVGDDEDAGARDYDYLLGLPIWSLTQERVDKLLKQMRDKKEEIDTLDKLSEKDLWCTDLDAFVEEWEDQLRQADDVAKTIRNTNRRRSNKIGAGGKTGGRGKTKKEDEEFTVGTKKKAPAKSLKADPKKGVTKVENKPHQGFMDMFSNKPKPKSVSRFDGGDDSGMSDEDFAALVAPEADGPKLDANTGTGRSKRAAAAAPKKWVVDDDEEDDSDDDNLLGDIDNMVKGIGASDKQDAAAANSRLSLFAMSTSNGDRPSSSAGLPKPKPKPSKGDDLSEDETNYEMLARSSPQKAPAKDEVDGFLSSDDEILPIVPKKPAAQKAKATKEVPKPKKASVAKKPAATAASKPAPPSPAAKAYAAKQNRLKEISKSIGYDEDESEDEDMEEASPPPKKPVAKGRQASSKTITKYVISDDSDEDIEMEDAAPPRKASNSKAASKNTYISDDEDDSIAPPPKRGAKPKSAPKIPVISDDEDESIAPLPKRATNSKPAPRKAVANNDEDEDEDDVDSPPKPAARASRGRPARAAAAAKPKKPVYTVDSDDSDEDDDVDESALVEEDESEDDFSE
ncbi:DNA topoisomerase 2 [Ciborinia camelliae]|nr:DNA topoisomerase 2 [Ciborinia camelliae]